MAGRTPSEAVQNYVDPLQKSLSCVTDAVLTVSGGYAPTDKHHVLALAGGSEVRLKGERTLTLSVLQHYRIVEAERPRGPWKVTIDAYYYALGDPNGKEIFAYHSHPEAHGWCNYPHMHLGPSCGDLRKDVRDSHLPTGRIALEELLRLIIREFGVAPRCSDWERVLDSTQAAFEEYRTWA